MDSVVTRRRDRRQRRAARRSSQCRPEGDLRGVFASIDIASPQERGRGILSRQVAPSGVNRVRWGGERHDKEATDPPVVSSSRGIASPTKGEGESRPAMLL